MSFLITQNVLTLDAFNKAKTIGLFAGLKNEVQTKDLFEAAKKRGKTLFFPKVEGTSMKFYKTDFWNHLQSGTFSILEPQGTGGFGNPDLILVPGLAFDRKKNRLGRGKGFYDRYFQAHPNTQKMGLCFSLQLLSHIEKQAHDVAMDHVITEQEVI